MLKSFIYIVSVTYEVCTWGVCIMYNYTNVYHTIGSMLIIQLFTHVGVICNNITAPEGSVISNCTSGVLGFGHEGDECIIKHYDFSELWSCQQDRSWTIITSRHILYTVYNETSVMGPPMLRKYVCDQLLA